jgi:hypothetical protein
MLIGLAAAHPSRPSSIALTLPSCITITFPSDAYDYKEGFPVPERLVFSLSLSLSYPLQGAELFLRR